MQRLIPVHTWDDGHYRRIQSYCLDGLVRCLALGPRISLQAPFSTHSLESSHNFPERVISPPAQAVRFPNTCGVFGRLPGLCVDRPQSHAWQVREGSRRGDISLQSRGPPECLDDPRADSPWTAEKPAKGPITRSRLSDRGESRPSCTFVRVPSSFSMGAVFG